MLDLSKKNPADRSAEGPLSTPSSERPNKSGQAAQNPLALKDLLGPTCLKTLYVGVLVPLLFAYLGSSNALTRYIEQAQWLVSKMSPVWPALPPQYELVLKIRGPGHAASFGFMCAVLWMWPIIILVALVRQHLRLKSEIPPVLPADIGKFIVVVPAGVFFLVLDTTTTNSPFARFYVDQWGFFYLRQWFFFFGTAFISAILVYLIGRIILDRTWRQSA
jgi:hypothetical protein